MRLDKFHECSIIFVINPWKASFSITLKKGNGDVSRCISMKWEQYHATNFENWEGWEPLELSLYEGFFIHPSVSLSMTQTDWPTRWGIEFRARDYEFLKKNFSAFYTHSMTLSRILFLLRVYDVFQTIYKMDFLVKRCMA